MIRIFAIAAILAPTLSAAPRTARDTYNEGLQKFRSGELKDAESLLRSAAATGSDAVITPALYNLGHVRFSQGKETLKGEGNRQELLESSAAAVAVAEEVLRSKKSIGEQTELREIIDAYMEARASRKQLRASHDANTRTMDLLGTALSKWRRSVGDFRSAAELAPADTDANFNADAVERHIQELLKFKEELEEQAAAVEMKREELKKLMGKLRGKIPKEMMQEGDGEEEDEDEEEGEKGKEPKGKTGDKQEQRIGGEREISPEMGRWLKETMKQRTMNVGKDGQPIGADPNGEMDPLGQPRPNGLPGNQQPKGKKGKDW